MTDCRAGGADVRRLARVPASSGSRICDACLHTSTSSLRLDSGEPSVPCSLPERMSRTISRAILLASMMMRGLAGAVPGVGAAPPLGEGEVWWELSDADGPEGAVVAVVRR